MVIGNDTTIIRFRRRLEQAAQRIIDALDALDAATEDFEDGADREGDPAELSGIGDWDGLIEQTVGEPSLGATVAIDQRVAWRNPRGLFVIDGEAAERRTA